MFFNKKVKIFPLLSLILFLNLFCSSQSEASLEVFFNKEFMQTESFTGNENGREIPIANSLIDPPEKTRHIPARYDNHFHIQKKYLIIFGLLFILSITAIMLRRFFFIKKLNKQLEEEKSLLKTLIENVPDYIYVKDINSRFILANPSVVKIMGVKSQSELIGKTDFDFYPNELASILYNDEQRIIKTGEPIIQKEELLKTRNGREVWISTTKVPLRDNRGKVTGIVGIGRDITSYKNLEKVLAEQRDRIKQYLDIVEVIIVVLDLNGNIQMINKKGAKLIAKDEKSILGRNWFELCSPDFTKERMYKLFKEVISSKGDAYISNEVPFICGSDNKERIISWQFTSVRNENGEVTGVLISGEDITQRVEAEKALRKTEKQLQISQRMEAVGRLTSGIAHDFNNLLSVIIGYSDLLMLKYKDKIKFYNEVSEIHRAAERAANLIRQLLIFSRKQIMQPKVINLNRLIKDIEKILRRTIGENIKFVIQLNPDLFNIEADPAQIEQILMNLVVNARDAMKNGGTLTIRTDNVKLDRDYAQLHPEIQPGTYVMLLVSDTGVGMGEEVKEHIFEPFFTTKKDGIGTGLGLSTVYGIVKQSGGSIYVYSEAGHGTIFKIYLPAVLSKYEEKEQLKVVRSRGGKETILLIEDDEHVRNMARAVLESYGYEVITANNGVEAIEVFKENINRNIPLIITDMIMPEMGGRECIKIIKEMAPERKITVLFISGYSETSISEEEMKKNSMYFLSKPFNAESFATKVREILDSNL